MLEKCLYVLQEVRSIIYFRQFIHPLSIHSRGNGTSFAFASYIIVSVEFCNIIFIVIFKQLLFSFILLPFVHLPVPKKNKTCNINQKLFIQIFLLKFLFSLLSIFLSYLSLLLNSNKASKIIFKTIFDVREKHIALHVTIFLQQNLYTCTHNTSYSWWNME